MHILAFETSSPRGSLALWHDCSQGQLERFDADRTNHASIFPALATLLASATELEMIAVGTGPGSYTGIRISLSAAIGLSMARQVPVIPIPSVCALVHAASEERYAVCGDARRGSWWWAEIQRGRLAAPPITGSPEEITQLASRCFSHIYTPDPTSPPFCEATPSWPRADIIAQRAASLTTEELDNLATIPPEPIYLRPPFITKAKHPPFLPAPEPT